MCDIIIKGKLVNLRSTVPSDVADYERWNNPSLRVWQFDGPWYDDNLDGIIKQRRNWLAGNRKPPCGFLEIETVDNVHIGWVVVYGKADDPHLTEIGIDIVEDIYWGKGAGTEALYLWITYLFRERRLHRIGFSTWSGNRAVLAVGRKLGFMEECRIRDGCEVNGVFYDRIKMGILREEWDRQNAD
ncbi:MAG: GNAT family N-acetyltransferase [candidate division Zixibacteria bacterium]|nr:GNAT family N-acetyltransferase [candidate division Zixibacteria bacterium]